MKQWPHEYTVRTWHSDLEEQFESIPQTTVINREGLTLESRPQTPGERRPSPTKERPMP